MLTTKVAEVLSVWWSATSTTKVGEVLSLSSQCHAYHQSRCCVVGVVNMLHSCWVFFFFRWLLNVPATCQCISGTDLLNVCLLVACLTSQQQASVSQGRICSDSCTCCHTETDVTDQTFYLTQSQYTDTGPTNPSADPITPGAWQGSHWSANF